MADRDPDELLTVAEVATELKVKDATVRTWIRHDKLPARRLGGGKEFRVRRGDLDTMLGLTAAPLRPPRAKRPFTATAAQISVR